jgi:hypothetical protein
MVRAGDPSSGCPIPGLPHFRRYSLMTPALVTVVILQKGLHISFRDDFAELDRAVMKTGRQGVIFRP